MIFDSTRDYTPPGQTPAKRLSRRELAKQVVVGLVFALIGRETARYFGLLALIPWIALLVVHLIAALAKQRSARFLHAVAFQVAHIFLMSAGAFASREYIYLADPIILGALVTWLIFRPGRVAAVVLGVVNLLDLAYNVFQILTAAEPSLERLLQLHVLLEIAVIGALVYGLFKDGSKASPATDTQWQDAQRDSVEPPNDVLPKP